MTMEKKDGVYVKDALANAGEYAGYGAHFAKAVAFLQRGDLMDLPVGRYEIDGSDVYAMVQEADLKPWGSGRPELHRAYFDIQLPLSGEETIGVGEFDPSAPCDFDEANDFCFCDGTPVEPMTLRPGEFAIFNPSTCAHAPCCSRQGAGKIRKIVVKVRK